MLATRKAVGIYTTVCLLLVAVVVFIQKIYGLDLEIYRLGGVAAITRPHTLYDPVIGVSSSGIALPFTYPPFAALLFIPLALIPFLPGLVLLTLISMGLVYLVARDLAPRLARHLPPMIAPWVRPVGLWALMIISGPFYSTLSFGQVNIIFMAVCYLAVRAWGFRFWAGFAIGLCGGIKLTPLAIGLVPLVSRKWSAVLGIAAAFGTTLIIGLLFLPAQTVQYFTSTIKDPNRVGNVDYVDNVSALSLLAREGISSQSLLWVAICLLLVAVGAWSLYNLRMLDFAAQLGVGAVVMMLISPITWSHHWVWWPVTVYTFLQLREHMSKAWQLLLGIPLTIFTLVLVLSPRSFLFFFGFNPHASKFPYFAGWIPNSIVIFSAVFLVLLAVFASKYRLSSGAAETSRRRAPVLK